MVVFIHGWVCLPCVNLDGTLLSMVFCIAVLNACHINSTLLSMFLCVVFKIAIKSSFRERLFNLKGYAFFLKKISVLIPSVAEKNILILVEEKNNNLIHSFSHIT